MPAALVFNVFSRKRAWRFFYFLGNFFIEDEIDYLSVFVAMRADAEGEQGGLMECAVQEV
jgi:hypothetical protein